MAAIRHSRADRPGAGARRTRPISGIRVMTPISSCRPSGVLVAATGAGAGATSLGPGGRSASARSRSESHHSGLRWAYAPSARNACMTAGQHCSLNDVLGPSERRSVEDAGRVGIRPLCHRWLHDRRFFAKKTRCGLLTALFYARVRGEARSWRAMDGEWHGGLRPHGRSERSGGGT